MTFVTYAQNYEDVLLWRALRAIEHGCYIDVGAADPDKGNVTRAFYEAGWRGVNVEPMEAFASLLRLRRLGDVNLPVAVGVEVGERAFYQIWTQPDETGQQEATGLSTLDSGLARRADDAGWDVRETRIEVTTLAAICRDHTQGIIHLLKVDTEGSEHEVLSGADFTSFRPWIMIVKSVQLDTLSPNHTGWEPVLLAANYHFVWFDGLNRFYVAAEHLGTLGPHFRTPLNPFDNFVRDNSGAIAHLTEAHPAFAEGHAETARLRERLERVASERDHAIAANEEKSAEFLERAAQHEQQLTEAEAEISVLRQILTMARAEIEMLKHGHAATIGYLERLAVELRWDRGPRALKAVLPVARLIRRMHGFGGSGLKRTAITQAAASISADTSSGTTSTTRSAADTINNRAPGTPARSRRRRLALLLYRPVRPLVRPLAWRLRTFLMAGIQHELRQLRDAQVAPPLTAQLPAVDLRAFGEAADRLLLTLALEHRENTNEQSASIQTTRLSCGR
jgi:FkbM family methyltransferase